MVKLDVAGRRRGKPHIQDTEVGHKGWEGPHIPNRLGTIRRKTQALRRSTNPPRALSLLPAGAQVTGAPAERLSLVICGVNISGEGSEGVTTARERWLLEVSSQGYS